MYLISETVEMETNTATTVDTTTMGGNLTQNGNATVEGNTTLDGNTTINRRKVNKKIIPHCGKKSINLSTIRLHSSKRIK